MAVAGLGAAAVVLQHGVPAQLVMPSLPSAAAGGCTCVPLIVSGVTSCSQGREKKKKAIYPFHSLPESG